MLVDLGRISRFGSVQVARYSQIMHLTNAGHIPYSPGIRRL